MQLTAIYVLVWIFAFCGAAYGPRDPFRRNKLIRSSPAKLISVALAFLFVVASAHVTRAEGAGWLGLVAADPAGSEISRPPASVGAVVLRTVPGSPAAEAGLQANDVIFSLNNQLIPNADTFNALLNDLREGATIDLIYIRDSKTVSVQVQLSAFPTEGENSDRADANPIVQVESGGHTGRVNAIHFMSGDRVLSAGDDKVVRMWDLKSQTQVRAFRGHHLAGLDGQIYALDVAPDERTFVVGGFFFAAQDGERTTAFARIVNVATGDVIKLLQGHLDAISCVDYSADGALIATGSADGRILVWDVASGKVLHRIHDQARSKALGVEFDGTGRNLFSYDQSGRLSVWDLQAGAPNVGFEFKSSDVTALAIAKSANVAAIGSSTGLISIVNAVTGATTEVLNAPARRPIGEIGFSPDGKHIAFTYGDEAGADFDVFKVDLETHREAVIRTQAKTRQLALAISDDGRLVGSSGAFDRAIAIDAPKQLDRQSSNSFRLRGRTEPVYAVAYDPFGARLGWGYTDAGSHNSQKEPLEFTLQLPLDNAPLGKPELLTSGAESFRRAVAGRGALSLAANKGGSPVRKYGKLSISKSGQNIAEITRGSHNGYSHTAYSFLSNSDVIVTGGQGGVLESYDSSGKLLGQFVGHTDVIWSVATGPLDRTLASSGSDQTIRFWNPTTRAQIASFVKATDGEWVMWLPQGFYTSSARGARLLGWQINHGVDKTPDFVTSEQYRRVLHRRDLVERAFALGSADEAVREAFPGGFSLAKLLSVQPPEVRIAGQSRYLRATGGKIRVATYIKSSDPNIIRAFAFVDGRKVDATEVPVLLSDPRPPDGWLTYAFEIELHSGRNEVELVAVNAIGASARHEAKFVVEHEGEGPLDARGKLWIVAIGVDDYPGVGKRCGATGDASCDLNFASIDAEAFSHSFIEAAGNSYAETRVQVLTNTPSMTSPTRDNILEALDELTAAEDNDTVVVFLAGHGETGSTGEYFFLPTDIRRTAGEDSGEGRNLIGWLEIHNRIANAKGRRLLFVDSCRAAGLNARRAYNDRLENDAYFDDFVAFAASGRNQSADEEPTLGHGLFTYAILEALEGRPAWQRLISSADRVSVYSLADFVSKRVSSMSVGQQRPETYSGLGDFVLIWR